MLDLGLKKLTPFPMNVPCLDGIGKIEESGIEHEYESEYEYEYKLEHELELEYES